jgi:hypothetical protein
MNKILSLSVMAFLAIPLSALAGGNGRTVCVMRARPVAIQPAPRPVYYSYLSSFQSMRPSYVARPAAWGVSYGNYYYHPRVPVVYGHINPRLHYINPRLPNGYVGGLQNLPTNYVNIPPVFTRPVARPAPHRGGHGGGGAHGGGGHGGGGGRGK